MKYCLFVAALFAAFAENSPASSVLLDTGVGTFLTFRTIDGPGQGVYVGADTTLNQIGFYMSAPSGGDIKFMIWDSSNSTLLFSEEQPLDPKRVIELVLSKPFSFQLAAGNTYYFGVIANIAEDVSALFPLDLTQNNLSLVNPNTNYENYDNPAFIIASSASIAIQLVGTPTSTPEPANLALLGLGILGLGAWRCRRASAKLRIPAGSPGEQLSAKKL